VRCWGTLRAGRYLLSGFCSCCRASAQHLLLLFSYQTDAARGFSLLPRAAGCGTCWVKRALVAICARPGRCCRRIRLFRRVLRVVTVGGFRHLQPQFTTDLPGLDDQRHFGHFCGIAVAFGRRWTLTRSGAAGDNGAGRMAVYRRARGLWRTRAGTRGRTVRHGAWRHRSLLVGCVAFEHDIFGRTRTLPSILSNMWISTTCPAPYSHTRLRVA